MAYFANSFVRGLVKSNLESPEGGGVVDFNLRFHLNQRELLFDSHSPFKTHSFKLRFYFPRDFLCFAAPSRIPASPPFALSRYLYLQARGGQSMRLPSQRRLIHICGSPTRRGLIL